MTRNKQDDSDRRLREKMDLFRPEVPEHLWVNIRSELDRLSVGSSKPVKGGLPAHVRRLALWWVAASLLIAVGGYWLLWPKNTEVRYLRGNGGAAFSEPLSRSAERIKAPTIGDTQAERMAQTVSGSNLSEDLKAIGRLLNREIPSSPSTMERLRTQKKSEATTEATTLTRIRPRTDDNDAEWRTSPQDQDAGESRLVTQTNGNERLDLDLPVFRETDDMVSIVLEMITPPIGEPRAREMIIRSPDPRETAAKSPAAVPRLLNTLVAQLDKWPEKLLSFSSDEEGSLKVVFNH